MKTHSSDIVMFIISCRDGRYCLSAPSSCEAHCTVLCCGAHAQPSDMPGYKRIRPIDTSEWTYTQRNHIQATYYHSRASSYSGFHPYGPLQPLSLALAHTTFPPYTLHLYLSTHGHACQSCPCRWQDDHLPMPTRRLREGVQGEARPQQTHRNAQQGRRQAIHVLLRP